MPRGERPEGRKADCPRPRERNPRYVLVLDEFLAHRAARAREVLQGATGDPRLAEDLVELEGEKGRVARGFQDDGIAGDERSDGHPGRDREREVERRDDGPYAEGAEHGPRALVREVPAHVPLEPPVRDQGLRVPSQEVDRLVDVRDRLVTVLPVLEGHEGREVELALRHHVRGALHDPRAFDEVLGAPGGEPGLRGGHRLAGVRPRALLEPAEDESAVRR